MRRRLTLLLLLAVCLAARHAAAQQDGGGSSELTSTTAMDDGSNGDGVSYTDGAAVDGTDSEAGVDGTEGDTGVDGADGGGVTAATDQADDGNEEDLASSSDEQISTDDENSGMFPPPSPDQFAAVDGGDMSAPALAPSPSSAFVPAPAPAALPSPLPPPPSPTPPPPPPVGTRVNLVLRLAGAPSPMAAELATMVASTISILTPSTPWTYSSQQPSYPGKKPEVPRDAAPAPATVPSSAGDQAKATVDPLPINGLGRKLRQAAAAAPELTKSAKGQCHSTKHALAPDEATCTAWCEGQLAAGKVEAAEYRPRFYDKDGAMCCGCTKKKGNTTDTNTTATPTTDTPTPVSEDTGTGTGVTPSPSPSTAPTTPATAELDEGADGVYLFAYTLVPTKAGEEELNATMYAAASARRLLDSLETTAGVSATSADIVFLGSGKYEFAPVPPKYVRPVYMPAPSTPTPPTEAASTSGSNGMMIGIILGSVAAAAIALALAATFCVRRRRQQKLNGQGLVHKWESERKQAEEERKRQQEERRAASQAANDRYWARQQSQRARSQKLEQLRSKLGMGPKDHLAAAAAKMEAAEAAEAANSAAAPPPPLDAESSAKSVGSSKGSMPAQSAAPTYSLEAHTPTPPTEAQPLASLVVPSQLQQPSSGGLAPAPSWATRDPGAEPKPSTSTFGRWFGRG